MVSQGRGASLGGRRWSENRIASSEKQDNEGRILTNANKGLASSHINKLDVRNKRNTLLLFSEICTYVFTKDVERTDLALRIEHSTGRAVEDNGLIGLGISRIDVAFVISPQHANGASLVHSVSLGVGS